MAPLAHRYRLAANFALSALIASCGLSCGAASAAPSKRAGHGHDAHDHAIPHRHVGAHYHRGHHHGSPTTSVPVAVSHHPRVVSFVDGYVQPPFPTPYPFDGKLAGDGILGTGILDSSVLRQAYGIVPN